MHLLKTKKYFIIQLCLLIFALGYYLFFVNKGLVFFDEGYFVHAVERIADGEVPYKDFSLQYGPTFFYFLAGLYKIFGVSIIVGRFFTVAICLGIIATVFALLNKLAIRSYSLLLLICFSLIAFGYPLLNIPNIMWANVLVSIIWIYIYTIWVEHKYNSNKLLICMGMLLALAFSLKQNLGAILFVTALPLILLSREKTVGEKAKNITIVISTFSISTFFWTYLFFIHNNMQGLIDVIHFSQQFSQSIRFSYPSLHMLLQPTGIFKLLPYYLPIIVFFITIFFSCKRKIHNALIAFSLVSTTGFFACIYPQSDLLHVYPFLGLVLVSFLLLTYTTRYKLLGYGLAIVMIIIGFYLTFFTGSYRYEAPYKDQNIPLALSRAQGISVTAQNAASTKVIANFITFHTTKNDYIFVYPYAPMLYVLLERKNPSKDSIYFLPTWHFYSDSSILQEIKNKKVKYIITKGEYRYDSVLSQFIQKQKQVLMTGDMVIFQTY